MGHRKRSWEIPRPYHVNFGEKKEEKTKHGKSAKKRNKNKSWKIRKSQKYVFFKVMGNPKLWNIRKSHGKFEKVMEILKQIMGNSKKTKNHGNIEKDMGNSKK